MYLPLTLTLLTELIFLPFAGTSGAEATRYYGHSYTGNALAYAAAKASPEILEQKNVAGSAPLSAWLRDLADCSPDRYGI
jgi:adenosylmethionine-8-amino-7-oxononanoate aminotransferase